MVSQTFVVLDDLVLISTGQIFCRISLNWYLMFFSLFDWCFGEEDHRDNVIFINITSSVSTIKMVYDFWCWPWLPGWGSVCQVSSIKWLLFPPLQTVLSVRKPLWAAHTQGTGSYAEYLHKFFWILHQRFLPYVFIHSPIFISMDYIQYCFILVLIVLALATGKQITTTNKLFFYQ